MFFVTAFTYLIMTHAQERFQLAEIHFRKALAINPHSSILMCHIAVVQHALQKSDRALDTLHAAIGKQT
jgi:anaphase-promoting complex subunit 3